MSKVVIVGGGLAGLSSGIFLKKHGFDVEIYEKNPYAGGFLTSWKRKGSIIDGCLHWMLGTKEGTKINKMWKELGALDETIGIIKTDSFYSVSLDDKTLTVYNDLEKCKAEFYKHSEGDDEEIKRMFDLAEWLIETNHLEPDLELPFELQEKPDMRAMMDMIRHMSYHFKLSLKDWSEKFHSPIIKMALNYALINNHFNAFYFIQTLANLFVGNDGLPVGGSHNMRDRIVNKYLSLGGTLFYNSPVSKIIIEEGKAKGIEVKGQEITGDYVISAIDTHYGMEKLLGIDLSKTEYEKFDADAEKYPAYSFIIAAYRTKADLSKEEVDQIKKIPEYSFMNKKYDYISVRHYGYDKELITDGYTTVQVMLTTYQDEYDYLKALPRDEYLALKKEIGEFYKTQLEDMFTGEFELIDVWSPLTNERWNNSFKGTFMPYPLIERMSQQIRPATTEIDNLIIAGQWLVSPGGVAISSITGRMAAQLILHKEGMEYKNI